MRLGSKTLGVSAAMIAAGMVASAAFSQGMQDGQQTSTTVPAASTQQQPLPDGPKPQTLPKLNTIVPTASALPDAPPAPVQPAKPLADAMPADGEPVTADMQQPVPAAPTPTAQTQDDGPKPELPAAGQGEEAFKPLRIQVNFVEIPFTVKDSHGQLVPGLTWRDVRVYENGLRQQMKVFTTDPFPLSVAVVVDQSVPQQTMEKINDSLRALQESFTPYDEVAVFTYNNNVKLLGNGKFTAAQSARLGQMLEQAKAKGRDPIMPLGGPMAQTTVKNNHGVDPNTDSSAMRHGFDKPEREFHTLNDAILTAAKQTATAGRGRRRIVFVISDGKEYGSQAKEKDVIKYLQTNKVAVYGTLVGDASLPGMGFLDRVHLPLTMRDDVLPRYAAATGGQVDPEFRPRGIQQSFAKITEQVRTQYTVGYYSHEPVLDGRFRKVEVRVMRPNLTVIAKDGYYPSADEQARAIQSTAPAPKR
ncbi:MAG: VWA domain-containing protein [Acidobacteriaceae bacterium]|nr:VWA domain-containing protein [Acidobacteriaceae bacterium]